MKTYEKTLDPREIHWKPKPYDPADKDYTRKELDTKFAEINAILGVLKKTLGITENGRT